MSIYSIVYAVFFLRLSAAAENCIESLEKIHEEISFLKKARKEDKEEIATLQANNREVKKSIEDYQHKVIDLSNTVGEQEKKLKVHTYCI